MFFSIKFIHFLQMEKVATVGIVIKLKFLIFFTLGAYHMKKVLPLSRAVARPVSYE